jgi:translation initiation factor 5A
MTLKFINATEARVGTNILLEGEPHTIKKIDMSSTGKHGHTKVRAEAVGIITGKKKVFVIPGHDKLEVPIVNKRKAQVLSLGDKVSVMDLESFETLEVQCPEEIKGDLAENSNVEYWEINGKTIVKRKL